MLGACLGVAIDSVAIDSVASASPPCPAVSASSEVTGVVRDLRTGSPIAEVEVALACDCLPATRVVRSDGDGRYAFVGLDAGDYRVRIVVGVARREKLASVPRDARFRIDFRVDPSDASPRRAVPRQVVVPAKQDEAAFFSVPSPRPELAPRIFIGTGSALLVLSGVLGTHYALVMRDALARGHTAEGDRATRHTRDAMIASFAVPGGVGLAAFIAGAVGLGRLHRRGGRHALGLRPMFRRGVLAGASLSGRF